MEGNLHSLVLGSIRQENRLDPVPLPGDKQGMVYAYSGILPALKRKEILIRRDSLPIKGSQPKGQERKL